MLTNTSQDKKIADLEQGLKKGGKGCINKAIYYISICCTCMFLPQTAQRWQMSDFFGVLVVYGKLKVNSIINSPHTGCSRSILLVWFIAL